MRHAGLRVLTVLLFAAVCSARLGWAAESTLAFIRVSEDGARFVCGDSAREFVVWGVNYDRDAAGRLLEDYWNEEWSTVVEDFGEMRALGANVVRIHLQLGRFMATAATPNTAALERLARLVRLAEERGLYLDITGLGCYHQKDVPAWYDALEEPARWQVQARFWEAIAQTCAASPAVFCYDLMNEPLVPGPDASETQWLAGELAGEFFCQRIALDLKGRTPRAVAKAWVETLVAAIRRHDQRHLVTVGAIPLLFCFPGAERLFYSPEVSEKLDFVSVHFYPKRGELEPALTALAAYRLGKPLVVEEIFPLECSPEEVMAFVDRSRPIANGWISFYWGKTIDQYAAEAEKPPSAAMRDWLLQFRAQSAKIVTVTHPNQ